MSGLVNTGSYSTTVYYNPYYQFEKSKISIKHEPTLFTNFKDQVLWDNWNQNTVATSCTQDVDDVLHKAYVTSTPDEMALFRK